MKKIIVMAVSLLLLLTICACATNQGSVTKTDDSVTKTDDKKENISWADYDAGGVSNILDVYLGRTDGHCVFPVENENETISAVGAYTICPYCSEEGFEIFQFSEFPKEKLGDNTVLIEKSMRCENWAKHTDSFTSEYKVSIILTLNSKQ